MSYKTKIEGMEPMAIETMDLLRSTTELKAFNHANE